MSTVMILIEVTPTSVFITVLCFLHVHVVKNRKSLIMDYFVRQADMLS